MSKKTLAIVIAVVTLLAFANCLRLFYIDSFKTLPGSYDTGWIIRTGCYILENGDVPRHDLYSWTNPQRNYVVYQWLFAAGMARLFNLGGLWLDGFACCLIAGMYYFFLLPSLWIKRGIPPLAAFLLLSLVLSPHWFEVRPQIVSFGLILAVISILESFRQNRQTKRIWLLPPIMLCWANVHLFWSMGLIAIIVYWLLDCIRTRSLSTMLGASLAASMAALLINPYGFGLIAYWWSFMDHSQWMQVVETSPPLGAPECQAQLAYLAIAAGLLFRLRRSVPSEGLIICAIVCIASLSARRMLTPAVFATWPYLGIGLASLNWPGVFNLNALAATAPPRTAWLKRHSIAIWPIGAVLVCSIIWSLHYPQPNLASRDFYFGTEPMLNLVAHTLKQNDHLFNDAAVGSWLILKKACPVFIDTRYDLYDKHFCEDYVRCLTAQPGWDTYIAEHHINYMIVRNECVALISQLKKSSNWQLVKTDGKLSFWKRSDNATGDHLGG